MRYYLIAGEASGDIYGSQLIEEIQILDPNSEVRFWGGDLMKSKSNNLVKILPDSESGVFFGFRLLETTLSLYSYSTSSASEHDSAADAS